MKASGGPGPVCLTLCSSCKCRRAVLKCKSPGFSIGIFLPPWQAIREGRVADGCRKPLVPVLDHGSAPGVYLLSNLERGGSDRGKTGLTPKTMAQIVTRGLVLREVNYKEGDKILTVLAEGQGKRTVKAPGCGRKNSPLAAGAQLLVFSDMTIFDYQERWILKEAATVAEFRSLRSDLERLALGTYFAEVVESVAEEGVETPGLLSLILNSLYALDTLKKPLELVKAAFEIKLCCLAGYEPLLDGCGVCGAEPPVNPMLHLREGLLHCGPCRKELGEGISLPLDPSALSALRYIVYGDPRKLFSFTLPKESLETLSGVAEGFLLTQLERGFRTLDFYKSLRQT